jgi:protein tyrosine/serine phosphatase
VPTQQLRPVLARDGIFNVRDLGGLPAADGRVVAPGRLVRGDALHRSKRSTPGLVEHGVVRVLDLRDQRERDEEGVLVAEGIEVLHHPVLDPTFDWFDDRHDDIATLLAHRYEVILTSFPDRFAGAVRSVVEVVSDPDVPGGVAYHCAVGKDRTGLLTALLLGAMDVSDQLVVDDYVRSARATAVQRSWLWTFGRPGGEATDDDLELGVWSARAETMRTTLDWLRGEHGGARGYLIAAGVDSDDLDALRRGVLVDVAQG